MENFISCRPERHESGHLFCAHGQIPWRMPSKGPLERLSRISGTETSYSVPFVGRTFPAALVERDATTQSFCEAECCKRKSLLALELHSFGFNMPNSDAKQGLELNFMCRTEIRSKPLKTFAAVCMAPQQNTNCFARLWIIFATDNYAHQNV